MLYLLPVEKKSKLYSLEVQLYHTRQDSIGRSRDSEMRCGPISWIGSPRIISVPLRGVVPHQTIHRLVWASLSDWLEHSEHPSTLRLSVEGFAVRTAR